MIAISEAFPELPATFASRLQRDLQSLPPARIYWVAFSGGLDSQVLLHALVHWFRDRVDVDLRAIHVHHGLSSNADAWAIQCRDVCQNLGVDLHVEQVCVDQSSGKGLEAAARQARYQSFEQKLGIDELLLLAHHQDDQAETLLLNLLRGSGVTGLAAMPRQRALGKGALYRPLLDWRRQELEQVARLWQLQWIDDESNADARFDRNFLRHQLMPLIRQRWPQAGERIAQTARWCAEADSLLKELAASDLRQAQGNGSVSVDQTEITLELDSLTALSLPRQRNLLREWLTQSGVSYPGERRFEQILSELIPARPDATPEIRWPGGCIKRYRQRLVLITDALPVIESLECQWDCRTSLSLSQGVLRADWAPSDSPLRVRAPTADEAVQVRFRQGGETCRPAPRGLRKPLKKLFQEWGVPPWQRESLPLLYFGETLVAVPGYMVASGYQALAGQPGFVLSWP